MWFLVQLNQTSEIIPFLIIANYLNGSCISHMRIPFVPEPSLHMPLTPLRQMCLQRRQWRLYWRKTHQHGSHMVGFPPLQGSFITSQFLLRMPFLERWWNVEDVIRLSSHVSDVMILLFPIYQLALTCMHLQLHLLESLFHLLQNLGWSLL